MHQLIRNVSGLVLLAMVGTVLTACPFCSMQGQTLTGEVQTVGMVLFGTLKNARLAPGGDGLAGTTELHRAVPGRQAGNLGPEPGASRRPR